MGRGRELPLGCGLLGFVGVLHEVCMAAEGPVCAWALLPAVGRALFCLLFVLLFPWEGVDVMENRGGAVTQFLFLVEWHLMYPHTGSELAAKHASLFLALHLEFLL